MPRWCAANKSEPPGRTCADNGSKPDRLAEKQSPRRGKSPGAMLALASIGKLKMVKDFPLPVDCI